MATPGLLVRMKSSARWSSRVLKSRSGPFSSIQLGTTQSRIFERAFERRPGRIIRAGPVGIEADRQRAPGLRLEDGGQHPVGQCALCPVQAGDVFQPAFAGRLGQPLGAGKQAGFLGALLQLGRVGDRRPSRKVQSIDPRRQRQAGDEADQDQQGRQADGPGHDPDPGRAAP